MTDKGLTIGEKSNVNVYNNSIKNNNIGIALKDESKACLKENSLSKNVNDIARYIKKNMYLKPIMYVDNQNFNKKIDSLEECNIQTFIENTPGFSF